LRERQNLPQSAAAGKSPFLTPAHALARDRNLKTASTTIWNQR